MSRRREISSIVRASKILRCLSNDIGRITDISKEVQLSKGTIHGILETLKSTGFAGQDPVTRHYCLGPLFHELTSNPFVAHKGLVQCSIGEMERLRDLSGETVALQIPNGSQRIILEEVLSSQPIRFTGGKGLSAPIHTGAGKILLSELEGKDLEFFLKNIDLVPVTSNTITDKEVLLRELDNIRKQGYATSFGERLPGSACIAVPVKDYYSPLTLSIIGPESRFLPEKMFSILDEMKQSAANISNRIKEIIRTTQGTALSSERTASKRCATIVSTS
ncbi:MAG: IclR family transcriptional regulator [Deltaproteobacteria bacterium]|nr:MAG: IclR family transcriptional regulator [Deltaproteobacteria bacterium]